ncbi:unnamed protein product [Trifolium pratense]|uniref:Uncharacterized protein n=1 Tax=Trifolium pratense TaxID=57577 RepID=A0ACB0LM06_TRIPR|nr:unnamed protein product [Trifolium pratense]
MQRVKNMNKIFKFVYVMLILHSLFLVSTQQPFIVLIPCKTDRDCPTSPKNLKMSRPKKLRCRDGLCV